MITIYLGYNELYTIFSYIYIYISFSEFACRQILSTTLYFDDIRFNQCSRSWRASFDCIDRSAYLRMQFVK